MRNGRHDAREFLFSQTNGKNVECCDVRIWENPRKCNIPFIFFRRLFESFSVLSHNIVQAKTSSFGCVFNKYFISLEYVRIIVFFFIHFAFFRLITKLISFLHSDNFFFFFFSSYKRWAVCLWFFGFIPSNFMKPRWVA